MGKIFKTSLCVAALTLGSVSLAHAQDTAFGINAFGQTQATAVQVEKMIDRCVGSEADNHAIMACTKLMRLTVDADVKASLMTQRAMHRVEQGNHKAAASDFERAAELSSSASLQALAEGFESVAREDYAMAQASFQNCMSDGDVAVLAEYGLSLTYAMAGESHESVLTSQ